MRNSNIFDEENIQCSILNIQHSMRNAYPANSSCIQYACLLLNIEY